MKTALCTISSNNFLPYGLTCLTSVEKFNDYDLFYLIADDFKDDLYKKYDLSPDEVKYIDSMIKPMPKEPVQLEFEP